MKNRVAYLGPEGTYSYQAARELAPDAELTPYPTLSAIIDALQSKSEQQAVLPIENASVGEIKEVTSRLAGPPAISIGRRLKLPVRVALMALPGVALATVTRLLSKDVLFPQCAKWITRELPNTPREPVSSTAMAAKLAAQNPAVGALGSPILAELNGLSILADGIQDSADNWTEFALVSSTQS